MDQNIQKALWLGVSIMMFIAVVSTGLFLFNQGRTVAEVGGDQLENMTEQLANAKYQAFDNDVVSGSMLINTIKEYKSKSGEFLIVVNTSYPSNQDYISSGTVSGTILTSGLTKLSRTDIDNDIKNLNDTTSTSYINPHGEFLAQLIYDNNDVVKGILATQQ